MDTQSGVPTLRDLNRNPAETSVSSAIALTLRDIEPAFFRLPNAQIGTPDPINRRLNAEDEATLRQAMGGFLPDLTARWSRRPRACTPAPRI